MIGLLNIDKPAGSTSHDVVARVRKIIGERRVGHTGTLDPFATGVLIVLVGRATRLAQFLSGADKEYEAVVRFGYATDTGDVTGKRLLMNSTTETERTTELRREEIEAAIGSMRGKMEQLPPMYSAKKISGRKLYEHARRGEQIEREPVHVTIHEFEPFQGDGEFLRANKDGSADLRVRVVCSAGTYVRVLAEDLGRRLGTAAHLAELRRTRAGHFTIQSAIPLEQLSEEWEANVGVALISPREALSDLPSIELDEDDTRLTLNGVDVPVESDKAATWSDGESIRMCRKGELIAVGKFEATWNLIHPTVVIGTA